MKEIICYSYFAFKKKLLINIFVTGILGGLVSVTGTYRLKTSILRLLTAENSSYTYIYYLY